VLAFREKQFHCTINSRAGRVSDVVFEKIVFRVHAIQRMYQRSITAEEVRTVIQTGETIEDYPNDFPYPSRLLLGWCGLRPIHVVVADNAQEKENIVVTVYEPERGEWEPDLKRRKDS
jgi:Domain of unknown function (DUF4258)